MKISDYQCDFGFQWGKNNIFSNQFGMLGFAETWIMLE